MAEDKTIHNHWEGANITNYGTLTGDVVTPQYTFFNNRATQEEILQKLRGAIQEMKKDGALTEDVQWYAVMRYLQDRYLAPKKKDEWLQFITRYVSDDIPLYDNYRRLPSDRLMAHSATWTTIGNPTEAEYRQIIVVKKMSELLV